MMAYLNFELKGYRVSPGSKKTEEMITDIFEYRCEYKELPAVAKSFCKEEFARVMALDYICVLDVDEWISSQTKEATENAKLDLALDTFMQPRPQKSDNSDGGASSVLVRSPLHRPQQKGDLEKSNTYKAMCHLQDEIHKEMKTGLLTVQLVCDVQRILMTGLHRDAGQPRECPAYVEWEDDIHHYPDPQKALLMLQGIIDRHNVNMDKKPLIPSIDETEYIFKCAAWLLFEFVNNSHPFGDGNGRMCRLLANYVLSLITPFPVSLYHTKCPDRCTRSDYLEAIVECRKNPEQGPQKLAAMLVEGAWKGWKKLFEALKERPELKSHTSSEV